MVQRQNESPTSGISPRSPRLRTTFEAQNSMVSVIRRWGEVATRRSDPSAPAARAPALSDMLDKGPGPGDEKGDPIGPVPILDQAQAARQPVRRGSSWVTTPLAQS